MKWAVKSFVFQEFSGDVIKICGKDGSKIIGMSSKVGGSVRHEFI